MKAFLVHSYGEKARFTEAEVEEPTAGPGRIKVEVRATSLNPVDHKLLTNDRGFNLTPPAILHMDVAGVITEVGEGVNDFRAGDEVYGCAGGLEGPAGRLDGALADYMVVDAALVAAKPVTLTFPEAAALPLVSITAWEALFDRLKIGIADHVLVHAGAGGVGHIALQLARAAGATVSTTVSTDEKAAIASDLGAHHIIRYHDEPVEQYVGRLTAGRGFDAVFDTVGGDNLDRSLEAVRTGGAVASIIGSNVHDLSPMHRKGLSLHLVFMLLPMLTGQGRSHHGEILRRVAHLVDSGKLKPVIDERVFGFSQANEAHAYFARGQHKGKIVLMRGSTPAC